MSLKALSAILSFVMGCACWGRVPGPGSLANHDQDRIIAVRWARKATDKIMSKCKCGAEGAGIRGTGFEM